MNGGSGRSAGVAAHLRSSVAALHGANVRLYLAGSALSLVGTFVQSFALWWLVLSSTDSTAALPITIGVQTAPILLLGTWGGSVVDRFDNKRLLVVTTLVNTATALVLGGLVAAGPVSVVTVYVFAALTGLVSVVERPALQAILSELAQPDEIASAVGLNAMLPPTARLLGPPIAALLIASLGISWCFFLNALSFVVFLALLGATRRDRMLPRRRVGTRGPVVREGLRYARRDPVVGPVLAMMFLVGFAGFNFAIILPLMVKYTFRADERVLAVVLSLSAVGSLVGGFAAAGVKRPSMRMIGAGAVVFGVLLMAAGAAPSVPWWAAANLVTGVAGVVFPTMVVSMLQQASRPEMLGRVMAIYNVAFFGTTPAGAVFVAWLTSALGARAPFLVGGAFVAVTGVLRLAARGPAAAAAAAPAAVAPAAAAPAAPAAADGTA